MDKLIYIYILGSESLKACIVGENSNLNLNNKTINQSNVNRDILKFTFLYDPIFVAYYNNVDLSEWSI